MTTYRVEVTYRFVGPTQVQEGLTADQAEEAAYSYAHDMAQLGGAGVTKLTIEVELTDAEKLANHLNGWARGNLQSHLLFEHQTPGWALLYTDPLDLVHEALHIGRDG